MDNEEEGRRNWGKSQHGRIKQRGVDRQNWNTGGGGRRRSPTRPERTLKTSLMLCFGLFIMLGPSFCLPGVFP